MIERDRVRALLAEGKRPSEVARILGCVPQTIFKIRRQFREEADKAGEAGAEGGLIVHPGSAPWPSSPAHQIEQPPRKFQTGGAPGVTGIGTGNLARVPPDPEVAKRERDIALLELDARRLEAEERLAKIKREAAPTPPPAPNGSDLAVLRLELVNRLDRIERDRDQSARHGPPAPASEFSSFIPLIQTFLQSLMTLLGQLVTKTSEAKGIDLSALQGLTTAAASPADSLATLFPLIEKFIEFANTHGTAGGESSDLAQIIGALAPVLGQVQTGPGQPAGARHPQQQQADPMQLRIASFLLAIEREATARTDPWTVAEAIERDLNLCPEEFRNLFLRNGTNEILAGLARFVPQQIHSRITGLMQQNQAARQWLEEFVTALHQEEVPEEELVTEEEARAEGLSVTPRFEEPPASEAPTPVPAPDVFGVGPNDQPAPEVPPPAAV